MKISNFLHSRRNLFGALAALEIVMLLVSLILSETQFFLHGNITFSAVVLFVGFLTTSTTYYFLYLILKILEYPKAVQKLAFGIVLMNITFYVLVGFIFKPGETMYGFTAGAFSSIMLLWSLYCQFVILKVIFGSKKTDEDHIWAAVTVYIGIIFIFGYLYRFILIFQPDTLGMPLEGALKMLNAFIFSLNAASGMDNLYAGASTAMQKLSMFQFWLSNLFLVVILGRLLSVPLAKRNY